MPPTISLVAHRKDQERRKRAQSDLKCALESYCDTVARERDLEMTELARIICSYACELYDSKAAGYLELPPTDPELLFGDAGILNIGLTLDDVWQSLRTLKVLRPRHWPDPAIYRDDDSPELRRVLRRLMIDKHVSFIYFFDHPWFHGEVRDCVIARVSQTRGKYELRSAAPRPESRAPIVAVATSSPTSPGADDLAASAGGPGTSTEISQSVDNDGADESADVALPEHQRTTGESELEAERTAILAAQREALLAEYKEATENPSNRSIYTAMNSNIHKPEFYKWLKGELPADSMTTINFERFLREKKPPIPKEPRG